MLEAVAGGYKLAPDAPAWPSPKRTLVDSPPNALPPAVVGVVCMRFRQLPAAAQQVLGAAAALGERVDTAQLATATRLDRIAVEQSLDLLGSAGSRRTRAATSSPRRSSGASCSRKWSPRGRPGATARIAPLEKRLTR